MSRLKSERNWLAGFALDEGSYCLAEPVLYQDSEEVICAWPQDTAVGYRAHIDFIRGSKEASPMTRRVTVLCEPGPGLSNRQLVANYCEISDPAELVAWGDEGTHEWSDGPTEYYVWICTACSARQVDSPQDEWIGPQLECIECNCPHPLPWDET